MTQAHSLSATEARRLIGNKQLSPVELLQSCLQRIHADNPTHNAIVTLDEAGALATARLAEQRVMNAEPLGLLHGLPVGVKDLEATAGMRTTYGSKVFEHHVPMMDDAMVARVRAAGGVLFCKTNTPEFGAGANTVNRVFGATGNPFDAQKTAAGSSGGSATALALEQMPLATGSDYGGSLRTPAGFCGVVGFRPSSGLVPHLANTSAITPWGVLGPMARTVDDAYLLLRAQAAYDHTDPYAFPVDFPEQLPAADLSQTRMAWHTTLGCAEVDRHIANVFFSRIAKFDRAFAVADETAPDFSGIHEIFEVHRGLAFVTSFGQLLQEKRDLLDRNVIDNTERGLPYTAADIGRAMAEQGALYRRVMQFFERYDVLICPVASVSPFPHSQRFVERINDQEMPTYMRWLTLSYAPTMGMCCAAALPCGRDHLNMPFGIQVIGPRGRDLQVLRVAKALEQVLGSEPDTQRAVPPGLV